MHYKTQELLELLVSKRPAPPQKSATKDIFLKFAGKYSRWLVKVDALARAVVEADEQAIQEAARNEPDNYYDNAKEDAAEMGENFLDEIVEKLATNGEASDDYNNGYQGGDRYHHEHHTDRSYNVTDAVALLDQLDQYEETDSGLWEGKDWEDVLQCKAAYTYGNAVGSLWSDLIKEINEAYEFAAGVLAENDAYDDVDAAMTLLAKLEQGEIAEIDEHCQIQKFIVKAVIDGKDGAEARNEQIKKLVEKTIESYKG